MWPFYTELRYSGGPVSARLRAEHHALVLFAFHQQSQRASMNVRGASVGAAVRLLRGRDRFSADAVDRRFVITAQTSGVDDLAIRLRGLVGLFQRQSIALDYEMLFRHLVLWQDPGKRGKVRRRWGSDCPRSDPPAGERGSSPTNSQQPEEKTA
jgi:CRISPR system Cascade subunit CasB